MGEAGAVGKPLSFVLLAMQVVFLVMFAWKGQYGLSAAPLLANPNMTDGAGADNSMLGDTATVPEYYMMFQDVHVMIFVGFGFLMTFLQRYGFGAVGFNLLIASYVIQWAIIVRELIQTSLQAIVLNMDALLTADFVAAAVLISFGAVLGKTTPLQLTAMATLEVILFCANEYIGASIFGAADVGGSIFIHTFGAYFGLTVARVLYRQSAENNSKEGSVYHSDLFSMIGTVFLWMYWPSFNAVAAGQGEFHGQHRAVVNTYLSLAASCVAAFGLSPLLNDGRINMVHIQNATLAGGVAVGATADNVLEPWGAVAIGAVAGLLSTAGYQYLTPFLTSKLKLHDTCGVNNLHGMPGLIAAIASIISAMTATRKNYGGSLCKVFAARCDEDGVEVRTAMIQGAYQAAALGVTLLIALLGGLGTGFVVKFLGEPLREQLFDDTCFWDIPDTGFPEVKGEIAAEYQNTLPPVRNPPHKLDVTEQRF